MTFIHRFDGIFFCFILSGAIYVNDCDDVQMIPIFLIVDGFVYIPFAIGLMPFYKYNESSDTAKQNGRILLIIGFILFIGWQTTGECSFI